MKTICLLAALSLLSACGDKDKDKSKDSDSETTARTDSDDSKRVRPNMPTVPKRMR